MRFRTRGCNNISGSSIDGRRSITPAQGLNHRREYRSPLPHDNLSRFRVECEGEGMKRVWVWTESIDGRRSSTREKLKSTTFDNYCCARCTREAVDLGENCFDTSNASSDHSQPFPRRTVGATKFRARLK